MSTTLALMNHLRSLIAPADDILRETRARRDAVLDAVATYGDGDVLRTYRSGSVASGLANKPVDDGDGGAVLDRRKYYGLGPDGDNELFTDVLVRIQRHIRPLVREDYPNVSVSLMKRGLIVEFHELLEDDQDPSVDLVIALNRKDQPGLWIPNRDRGRWDASDPEGHVALLLAGDAGVRRTRAHVIRLAKAWNRARGKPPLCSFNIAALGLEIVTAAQPIDVALLAFFKGAAASLRKRLTEDPAGVSDPIRLPYGKEAAVDRLDEAAAALTAALAADDDPDTVASLVAALFPGQLTENEAKRVAYAASMRIAAQRVGVGTTSALVVGAAAVPSPLKRMRSFGQ